MTKPLEPTPEAADAGDPPSPEPKAAESPGSFLVSVGVTLALVVGFEVLYRDSALEPKIRQSSYSYVSVKAADYATLGGDVVVTGDSRMFHAVVPQTMHDVLREVTGGEYTAYNFGIPSGTTPIFRMAAHAAATHKQPPRVFVLGVTPALFSCCDAISAVGTSSGVKPGAIPGFLRATWWIYPEEAGASLFYGTSRLAATRTEVLSTLKNQTPLPPLAFHHRGWVSLGGRVDAESQDTRANGRATAYASLMDKSKGIELRKAPGQFLRVAIRELKSAGVKVVVIGTPQARQLDRYHDAAHTYFEYLEEVKRVTSEEHVPFVDCNAPPGIENSDFQDGDHLSEQGGRKFTRYLATEVVAPLLR